jgi:subtilisin family serine protease
MLFERVSGAGRRQRLKGYGSQGDLLKMKRSPFLTNLALSAVLLSQAALVPAGAQTRAEGSGDGFEALTTYAQELTRLPRRAGNVSADDGASVRVVMRALARGAGRNNPLVVTEDLAAGGALVESLARRVASGDVPASLRGQRIFRLDAGRLLSETGGAEFARRFDAVLREAGRPAGRVVLFLENLDGLLSASAEGQARAALDSLARAVERGSVRLVGTITPAAFELRLARDERFEGRFQEVYLDRPESAQSGDEEDSGAAAGAQADAPGFVGDKISPDLRAALGGADAGGRVPVILQGEDLRDGALREFLKSNGARVGASYAGLGAQLVEVPAGAVERLAELRGVSHLSLDREVGALGGHVSKTTGKDDVENDEVVSATGVVTVRKLDGKSIGIAVLDSGVYAAHRMFKGRDGKSRVVYSKDFTGEGRTDDPYGHGTHVAGLAAGNGQIANGAYEGVAPDASIVNLRVLNSQGTGKVSSLLSALNWLLANRTYYNVRVVNVSLGASAADSYRNDPVCRAVRKLVDAGVVVVAAAGNDGKNAAGRKVYGQIHSPGHEPSALTVGAVNTFGTDTRADDGVATYSSRGPTRGSWLDAAGVRHYDNLVKPDLVAPGNKLVSAESVSNLLVRLTPALASNVSSAPDSEMMSLSGTSMATPVVAGSAALLLQVNPKLTPNMVKAIMMYTAQQLRGFNTFEQGAGQLNVAGAVTLAKIVRADLTAATPVGTPVFTRVPGAPYTTIAGYTFPWSGGVIVGHTFATGYGLALYQKVYGLGTLLGDGVTSADGALLADRTAWSSGVVMSDQILTSKGSMMSDGVHFCAAGALLGDGTLLGDGSIMGDGVVMSDGAMLGDAVIMGDNTRAMLALLYGDPTAAMAAVKDGGVINLNY